MAWKLIPDRGSNTQTQTLAGNDVAVPMHVDPLGRPTITSDMRAIELRLEYARLRMLRGYEELLCLEGLRGVEHLPHQIDTVRRVLRHFRGRVLLADEVGLGKTIEACLLLREYVQRGLIRRVLILTPAPLVSQWHEELDTKFNLAFRAFDSANGPDDWAKHDRVLASLSLAKSRRHFPAVAACTWDLVIVDEAHHCKNRTTLNWKLVNALQRKHLFLLTATPVQNNLVELYNLLTLLEPGHLKTESDFKRMYMTRGNPRDPRNRHRLRGLLGDVMIRNTRSLVQMNLPPRYAQTLVVTPGPDELLLQRRLDEYLRRHAPASKLAEAPSDADADDAVSLPDGAPGIADADADNAPPERFTRMQLASLLLASGSHPATLAASLSRHADRDAEARLLRNLASTVTTSGKEQKLLELLRQHGRDKTLVFANFRVTLARLADLLTDAQIPFTVYSGQESSLEKDMAVDCFQNEVPVMLCSESGGEGRNLQFCNTLVNFDLPWNPMRIEQRVGRIHRYGQKREVFIFNLCAAESLEAKLLGLLHDKIRMFELVVGEVGSILGNLDGGEEFESLVLDLWLRSRDTRSLDEHFHRLGESLLAAQSQYLETRQLDDALFGEDFE